MEDIIVKLVLKGNWKNIFCNILDTKGRTYTWKLYIERIKCDNGMVGVSAASGSAVDESVGLREFRAAWTVVNRSNTAECWRSLWNYCNTARFCNLVCDCQTLLLLIDWQGNGYFRNLAIAEIEQKRRWN